MILNNGMLFDHLKCILTLYNLVSYADIFCKQFGTILFDTLMVFLKEFFEKFFFF